MFYFTMPDFCVADTEENGQEYSAIRVSIDSDGDIDHVIRLDTGALLDSLTDRERACIYEQYESICDEMQTEQRISAYEANQ